MTSQGTDQLGKDFEDDGINDANRNLYFIHLRSRTGSASLVIAATGQLFGNELTNSVSLFMEVAAPL